MGVSEMNGYERNMERYCRIFRKELVMDDRNGWLKSAA